MNLFIHIGVFAAYMILDFIFAEYNMACADKRPWRAAWFAALIPIFSATVVLAYVEDPVYIISAAAGGFVGTLIAVWRSRKSTKRSHVSEPISPEEWAKGKAAVDAIDKAIWEKSGKDIR